MPGDILCRLYSGATRWLNHRDARRISREY
jgi:hypothetical protein